MTKKKARNRMRRPPVHRLETRIAELAEHHERQKKHERRQRVFPPTDRPLAFIEPEHEKRERSNHARGRGNGKAGKIFVRTRCRTGCGDAVEPRQPQCAAGQINEGDHPSEIPEFAEHDLVNEQRRRDPEGNDIGERIELAAKRALMPAEPRQPSIEQIENAGREDEPDRVVKIRGRREEIDLAARRRKCAGRQQTRRRGCPPSSGSAGDKSLGCCPSLMTQGRRAITVAPPTTRSPFFTSTSASSGR